MTSRNSEPHDTFMNVRTNSSRKARFQEKCHALGVAQTDVINRAMDLFIEKGCLG